MPPIFKKACTRAHTFRSVMHFEGKVVCERRVPNEHVVFVVKDNVYSVYDAKSGEKLAMVSVPEAKSYNFRDYRNHLATICTVVASYDRNEDADPMWGRRRRGDPPSVRHAIHAFKSGQDLPIAVGDPTALFLIDSDGRFGLLTLGGVPLSTPGSLGSTFTVLREGCRWEGEVDSVLFESDSPRIRDLSSRWTLTVYFRSPGGEIVPCVFRNE